MTRPTKSNEVRTPDSNPEARLNRRSTSASTHLLLARTSIQIIAHNHDMLQLLHNIPLATTQTLAIAPIMDSSKAEQLIDELEALIKRFRELQAKPKAKPNPWARRPKFPQFAKGDRVIILSPDHYNKKATVLRIRGEQQWWVRLDDGTEFYRKYSSLKLA